MWRRGNGRHNDAVELSNHLPEQLSGLPGIDAGRPLCPTGQTISDFREIFHWASEIIRCVSVVKSTHSAPRWGEQELISAAPRPVNLNRNHIAATLQHSGDIIAVYSWCLYMKFWRTKPDSRAVYPYHITKICRYSELRFCNSIETKLSPRPYMAVFQRIVTPNPVCFFHRIHRTIKLKFRSGRRKI